MRSILASMIGGASLAFAASCASNDDEHGGTPPDAGGKATCQSFVQMLTDCAVIEGTRLKGCADDDPKLECVAACVPKVSCDEVKATYCFNADNAYADCLEECSKAEQPPEFTCGDGSKVSARFRCDGVADCPGGEDEDCPTGTFTCANGVAIPAGWYCDGFEDCAGSDDEANCGPPFTCDDGTSLGSSKECNGEEDCAGGEDERDCTTRTCD